MCSAGYNLTTHAPNQHPLWRLLRASTTALRNIPRRFPSEGAKLRYFDSPSSRAGSPSDCWPRLIVIRKTGTTSLRTCSSAVSSCTRPITGIYPSVLFYTVMASLKYMCLFRGLVKYSRVSLQSQFVQVRQYELPKMRKAIESFGSPSAPYEPKLSIVVCGKRHNTRFYPTRQEDAARDGNPLPGTVVDRGVTLAYEFDFFLQGL